MTEATTPIPADGLPSAQEIYGVKPSGADAARMAAAVADGRARRSGQGASHNAADQVVQEIRDAGAEAVANYDSVSTREGGAAIVQSGLFWL